MIVPKIKILIITKATADTMSAELAMVSIPDKLARQAVLILLVVILAQVLLNCPLDTEDCTHLSGLDDLYISSVTLYLRALRTI